MLNINSLWNFYDDEGNLFTVPDENKWNLIRQYRNELLTRCDWTQLSDAPLTEEQKTLWSTYRKDLRDLPSNYLTPEEVVFPTEPIL